MSKSAIYCRISSDRSGTELGVARQLDDCRALAIQRGLVVSAQHEYTDNDMSAFSGKARPEYGRLIAAVRSGDVDKIIVWQSSRLLRSRRDRFEAFELFRKREVNVIAVRGSSLDFSTASGRMLAGILGEFDTAESEIKSERLAAQKLQNAQRGLNPGGPRAFGFTEDGMSLVESEADLVRKMHRDLVAGMTLRAICRSLEGVATPAGRTTWHPVVVSRMLCNPRYAGLRQHRGEVIGAAKWPAVIDEDSWRRSVGILTNPARRSAPHTRLTALVGGWALCARCGQTVYSASRGRGVPVYRCRPGCVNRKREPIDQYIGQLVIAILSQPNARDVLLDDRRPDVQSLRAEVTKRRLRLDGAADQYAAGAIDLIQLGRISATLRTEIAELQGQYAHVDRAPVLRELVDADDVMLVWDALSIERRRVVVRVLMDVMIMPVAAGRLPFNPESLMVIKRSD